MSVAVRVVVGAGPAGLAASARLARAGCPHIVLERERVGWSWRAQRWDSFRLNSPAWMNRVPGKFLRVPRDSFAAGADFVIGLEQVARRLPVAEHTDVLAARRSGPGWRIETSRDTFLADAVVVASGFQNVPRTPAYARELPRTVGQLHAADYRRPTDVGESVLVVGGAQTGLQIADELVAAGKRVFLSTSRVGRIPRSYAGRDAYKWLRDTGQLELTRAQADLATIAATPPQLAGGRTVSYQELAARGAVLLGRTVGVQGGELRLRQDVGDNVRFADEVSESFRAAWSTRARLLGRVRANADPADEPAPKLYAERGPATLDLGDSGISSVIWATGFGPSTGWLPEDALDAQHRPRLSGLYVIGAPWLTHRASGNLYGMPADAEGIAAAIARRPLAAAA